MGDTEKRSFGQTNVKGYGATSAPYHDMEDVEYNDDHSRHGDEERGMSSSGDRTRNTNSGTRPFSPLFCPPGDCGCGATNFSLITIKLN
jgi:hypothetical protein